MHRKRSFLAREVGFTLIELLIVIVIISILAGIALVSYPGVVEKSRASKAGITIFDIANAEKRYFLEEGDYTMTLTSLDIYDSNPSTVDDDFDYGFYDDGVVWWARANKVPGTRPGNHYRLSVTGTRENRSTPSY